jgi:hypothetical protein
VKIGKFIRYNITRLPIFSENFDFITKSLSLIKSKFSEKQMGSRVIFG